MLLVIQSVGFYGALSLFALPILFMLKQCED